MTPTLHWGDPPSHFWLRHTRKAQEPILLFGNDAEPISHLLAEQMIPVAANPADMPSRPVGMVGLTYGELTHQRTITAQVTFVEEWYKRLMVGGKFVVVFAIPDMELIGRASASGGWSAGIEQLPASQSEGSLYRWRTTHCDPVEQTLNHHDIYEQTDEMGTTLRRWHTHTMEYYLFPHEARLMLERVGFLIEGGYGGWSEEPLQVGASIQVWVARKGV